MISSKVRKTEAKELIQYLCYRYNRLNLVAMLKFLGEEEFVYWLDYFAGCYIKIPSSVKIYDCLDDFRLHIQWEKVKRLYEEQKLLEYEVEDAKFRSMCKKRRMIPKTGRKRANRVGREIKECKEWFQSMQRIENQQDQSASIQ